MKNRIRHLASLLAATSLTGCIIVPLPMPYGPPPGFRGEGPPGPSFDGRRPPPPMAAWDMCEGQPEGARPAVPGPRADALTGTCERGPSGELAFRPSGPANMDKR
ncbi:hypothetical protein [Variovorax sp. PAMC26660]|uniref:hypothetical protein n=1 Tax=Variovorax sp. PAMC26660 TaxID=2762322 RepID=UPI00164E772B|nr:hypothetical protein [Variovorax sp. PAMC26660]QNK69130.1 hypothetical protein H7F35_05275 [Variovorax sp. PAMC26660]